MNKNVIYMVAIDDNSTKVRNSDYAQYSIASWTRWCEKNDIDFHVITESKLPENFKPIWNKELICEDIPPQYDKFGIVDADTIIHPNAPNIFDQIEDGVYGVNDLCDLNWLLSSIADRQEFFPDVNLDIFKYINAGVIFASWEYASVIKSTLTLYSAYKDEIDAIKDGGKEQTLLNFVLQDFDTPIHLLSPAWNLLSIHRKNMFTNNWQLHPEFKGQVHTNNPDSWPYFLKYAYIYHFTGFPIEDRTYYMSVTWDLLKQI